MTTESIRKLSREGSGAVGRPTDLASRISYLVSRISETRNMERTEAIVDSEPVVVAAVQGEFEEQALRTFLEANGIPTVVRGEALRKTHAFVLDGLGAVEIMVAPEHVLQARDLIAKVEAGELELAEEFPPPDETPAAK